MIWYVIVFVCYRGGQLTTFTHNQFNVTINGTMRDSDDYALGKLGNWTMTVIDNEIIILQIYRFIQIVCVCGF